MTIVNTKKEVIQLRMEGSKTEDEAKIPLATIVLRPQALGWVSSFIVLAMMECRWERTNRGKENNKLEEEI